MCVCIANTALLGGGKERTGHRSHCLVRELNFPKWCCGPLWKRSKIQAARSWTARWGVFTNQQEHHGNRLCLRPVAVGAALTRMSDLQAFANKDCYAVYQIGAASCVWKAQSAVSTRGVMLTCSLR